MSPAPCLPRRWPCRRRTGSLRRRCRFQPLLSPADEPTQPRLTPAGRWNSWNAKFGPYWSSVATSATATSKEPKGGLKLDRSRRGASRGRIRAGRRAGQTGRKLPDPVDRLSRRLADAARRQTERCPDRHADPAGSSWACPGPSHSTAAGHGRRRRRTPSLSNHRRATAVLGVSKREGRAAAGGRGSQPGRAAKSTATSWPGWSRTICPTPRRPIGGR